MYLIILYWQSIMKTRKMSIFFKKVKAIYCSRVGKLRKRFDDCFVGLSFPQDPTTHFLRKFILTRPATTFGLVKATRLTANLGYEREPQDFTPVPPGTPPSSLP